MSLIPAFVLIGLSWNVTMLYVGLALYSFGELEHVILVVCN